ncbi:MAG: hypothetical protein IPO69_22160 [Saprospiraceae bacterium]|nr:hypothetical protein [Saprospiraceae bacterium]
MFLASSNESSAKTWDQINQVIYPYRSIALLSINELKIHWPIKADLNDDNFRTEDRCLWQLIVHPLMEISPIIVVDGNCDTPFVMEEVERLIEIGAIRKTFFVTENKTFPVLNKLVDKLDNLRTTTLNTINSKSAPIELRMIIQDAKNSARFSRKYDSI